MQKTDLQAKTCDKEIFYHTKEIYKIEQSQSSFGFFKLMCSTFYYNYVKNENDFKNPSFTLQLFSDRNACALLCVFSGHECRLLFSKTYSFSQLRP